MGPLTISDIHTTLPDCEYRTTIPKLNKYGWKDVKWDRHLGYIRVNEKFFDPTTEDMERRLSLLYQRAVKRFWDR